MCIRDSLETGSAEALARTVKRLHELQTACLQETTQLSAIVTSNKQATEVNAQTIKGVEGLAKDNNTNLALTNARIGAMSARMDAIGGERNRNQEFRFRFRQCRYWNFWQEKAREFVVL